MPDMESARAALQMIKETGRASFPCIRYNKAGAYFYGDLYPEGVLPWKPGDRQQ